METGNETRLTLVEWRLGMRPELTLVEWKTGNETRLTLVEWRLGMRPELTLVEWRLGMRPKLTMLQTVVGPIEIGVDDSVPTLGPDVGKRTQELPSAIVDQEVDLTTVVLNCVLHQSFHLEYYCVMSSRILSPPPPPPHSQKI